MANYIGIDIGGTAIKYGLVTGGGEFLHRGSVPTEV
jgi:predicted NBD/HSP70 family sugar kinase